jgi:hypothetical protein
MAPPPAAVSTTDRAADFSIPSRRTFITWQEAIVALALGVNAAWILLLGYGVGKLAALLSKIFIS